MCAYLTTIVRSFWIDLAGLIGLTSSESYTCTESNEDEYFVFAWVIFILLNFIGLNPQRTCNSHCYVEVTGGLAPIEKDRIIARLRLWWLTSVQLFPCILSTYPHLDFWRFVRFVFQKVLNITLTWPDLTWPGVGRYSVDARTRSQPPRGTQQPIYVHCFLSRVGRFVSWWFLSIFNAVKNGSQKLVYALSDKKRGKW